MSEDALFENLRRLGHQVGPVQKSPTGEEMWEVDGKSMNFAQLHELANEGLNKLDSQ